jgi:membrane protease YdiL (CAAX protease family)
MLLGQLARGLSAWPSAVLVSIGAAAGGLPLFWTIIVPVAVAVVVACSIALARRSVAPA